MRGKSSVQRIITCHGDASLKFLLWKEDQHIVWRFLFFPISFLAHLSMIIADTIDDVFDHYRN